jgi:hypothetical protein
MTGLQTVLRGMVVLAGSCALSLWARATPSGTGANAAPVGTAQPPCHVELRRAGDAWGLTCDGRPFFIRGAGGDAQHELLKARGGNAFRLWGADDIEGQLAEANRLGLKVAVGIWLEHVGGAKHFDYHDPAQAQAQLERAKQAILKYKDDPAVLVWGIGNEMEGERGDDPAIWANVDDIAAMAHKLDPNHPTMTVVAELGGVKVPSINRCCPHIDIVGINSYAGATSVAKRYRELGGTKPFIITEFGPAGTWEVGRTPWKAPIEVTSTEKAEAYRNAYEKSIASEQGKLCLGSFAFLWGNKEEATATWFGMLLPDGSHLESVDVMGELWTGKKPEIPCPKIRSVTVDRAQVRPGGTIRATLDAVDPTGHPLTAQWVVTQDPARYITGGDFQRSAAVCDDAVFTGDLQGAELHMPKGPGPYWLYAYVRNDAGGAATAVQSLCVTDAPIASSAKPRKAPLVIYGDGARATPFAWSGWMGDNAHIALDDKCTDNPHSGATCMKCEFRATSGFAGIAGQNPPNDWGDVPGGIDLSGSRKLTFWARGEAGGEVVSFKVGILGGEKKYPDSDHAELTNVTLTRDWKQYEIDLAGKDLHRIKTGFVWVLDAHGKPTTFYLDDIQYE